MMAKVYSAVLGLHAVFGVAGLVLFWIPVLLQKGSFWHKRAGRYFALTMIVAAASGLVMAIMMYLDPVGIKVRSPDLGAAAIAFITAQSRQNAVFLALLSVLLFTTVQRSLAALKAKDERRRLRGPAMLFLPVTLGLLGLVVLGIAIRYGAFLFGGFAVVAIVVSALNLRYALKPRLKRKEWILEHLANALGSGIAAHTGFLVFGASSLLGSFLRGNLMLIPWFAPTVVGVAAIVFWVTRYARSFGYFRN